MKSKCNWSVLVVKAGLLFCHNISLFPRKWLNVQSLRLQLLRRKIFPRSDVTLLCFPYFPSNYQTQIVHFIHHFSPTKNEFWVFILGSPSCYFLHHNLGFRPNSCVLMLWFVLTLLNIILSPFKQTKTTTTTTTTKKKKKKSKQQLLKFIQYKFLKLHGIGWVKLSIVNKLVFLSFILEC